MNQSKNKTSIHIQNACDNSWPIVKKDISKWALTTLEAKNITGELTIRFTNLQEIQYLNKQYRNKDKPTNVLSFTMNKISNINLKTNILGDIIICPTIIDIESRELNKSFHEHLSHIVVHGVLHILGYDHEDKNEEIIMQLEETKILRLLGFPNPYKEDASDE